MTHEQLVEAVARAMCATDPDVRMGDADGVVQQRVNHLWRAYMREARAAIAVIRDALAEPTPEMVGAFWRVKNGHHFHDEPPPQDRSDYAAYRAMFSASPLHERMRG